MLAPAPVLPDAPVAPLMRGLEQRLPDPVAPPPPSEPSEPTWVREQTAWAAPNRAVDRVVLPAVPKAPRFTFDVRKGLALGALAAVLLVSVVLVRGHRATVTRDAVATVTQDLRNVAQFEHMANVYNSSYASHGQLLRNGWTEPHATRLTFTRVVPHSYCITGTLHGVTLTVRQDEVISSRPC